MRQRIAAAQFAGLHRSESAAPWHSALYESNYVAPLLDSARDRGFAADTCALDKGYDVSLAYDACEDHDVRPIIPLRETPAVKAGKAGPPTCEHGEWRFAGSEAQRGEAKWRCPTGSCTPFSRWVKADRLHPLVPRESKRWKSLYRGRAAVEREFGRLKNEWALLPLRVRGIERVRLHADLTISPSWPARWRGLDTTSAPRLGSAA